MKVKKNRLEAFSDGVIAIIITIMVLELAVPAGHDFEDLMPLLPILIGYVLSFVFISIYWMNHHRLFEIVDTVDAKILWGNLNFLFWISLIPFATAWLGENVDSRAPVIFYSVIILIAGLSYKLLVKLVARSQADDKRIINAFFRDKKGIYGILVNAVAVLSAFIHPNIAIFILFVLAVIDIAPDKRATIAYAALLAEREKSPIK